VCSSDLFRLGKLSGHFSYLLLFNRKREVQIPSLNSSEK
jgi:hypothetical protein